MSAKKKTIETRCDTDISQLEISEWVLKYLMEVHNLTKSSIADVLGVHRSFLTRVEKRERSFSMENLLNLAEHYSLPLPALIEEAAEQQSPSGWDRQTTDERETKATLNKRSNLRVESWGLGETLAELKSELKRYWRQSQGNNQNLNERIRRILKLCDEVMVDPNSQGSLLCQRALLIDVCRCLTERLFHDISCP